MDYQKKADEQYNRGKRIEGSPDISVTGHTIEWQTKFLAATQVALSNGVERTSIVLPDSLGVIPITSSGTIFLVRALRVGSLTKHWEIPQERVEENETSEEATLRCLTEEVGVISIEKIEPLLSLWSFPDRSTEKSQVMRVWGFFDPKKHTDTHELAISDIADFSREEIMAMIQKSEITCPVTISALLWHFELLHK